MQRLPRQPEVNIGTAGHVDHGKTTLVEAITGVWTSAHSEELRRGITIKVGYADAAFYSCPTCTGADGFCTSSKCPRCGSETRLLRVVSFVDCPGHESLMANMLSGAAIMDGALLVIAANEDVPKPQTREHLLALQMLGMKHIVVAQNKVDLVDDVHAEENYQKIIQFTKGTIAQGGPVIPISAQHRVNIDVLISYIEGVINTPVRDPNAPPLMHVLRSFDINRPGSGIQQLKGGVIGGSLSQGKLQVGAELELRPGLPSEEGSKYWPIRTKVRSIGTSAGLVESAEPGGLVALGTGLDPSLAKADSLVGNVVGIQEQLPDVMETVAIETQLFEMAVGTPELVRVEKIRLDEPLRLNVGTAVTLGLVTSVKEDTVIMKLRRPVCCSLGARAAISRRIGDRWRLIGSGTIT